MSFWSRIRMLFNMKASSTLNRLEDPRQVMDYAHEQQYELLRQVRRGLVEVATSKRQLEQQVERLQSRVPQTEEQARKAMAADREDLARLALERKRTALAEVDTLVVQLAEAEREERKLAVAEQQLASRIEDFRIRKEANSARYTAAEAQVKVNEALTGISGELADLSRALGRAEEKTRRMTARASALDALIDSGSLAIPLDTGDPIARELRILTDHQLVDEELDDIKRELNLLQPPESPNEEVVT